ncbi:glycerophosphoryl diester phosphodiesterase [Salinibacterium amurskyense]|uniref:Glycerophosphoryl diester phosphodiesterase n=1 Tax=Salinibacterium amurskyense TaxID=205941 RepID=A0A2M9D7U2_9MICO|nr:glycerophosphodiester phosphodiesterase family protein [Salinibacterium amurskyense]PJJ81742.1 glycerophosphoryl diester phosphodiesterase [Salinibacterium amurskyense]RLQ83717.1 hypothetical protein D9C83_04575 [Salinibacterium amurskyense]GHD79425.1 glycerophosphoryl diester phosphodiesterase [Salinibacterium amurskyense]
MTLVFARRGAADVAPENSLVAIEHALRDGVDGIEVEARLSRDAELVVIRDASVSVSSVAHDGAAKANDGAVEQRVLVEQLTLAELKTVDIGGRHDGCGGTRIPTLAEVFDLLAGSDAHLVVDIKEDPQHREGASPAAIAVAELVRKRDLHDRVTLTSTNHISMAAISVAHPKLQVGLRHLVVMEESAQYAAELGAGSLHPVSVGAAVGDVNDEERSVMVCASTLVAAFWPVSEEDQLDQLFELGVDAVVTDSYQSALTRRGASA